VAGQSDDRHVAFVEDPAGRLDTVDPRQAQVDQDEIGPMLAGELDSFDPVSGVGADVEACVFEDQTQIGANDRVIFDGEYTGCSQGRQGLSPGSGTKKGPRRIA
jgi:hypothetical protein